MDSIVLKCVQLNTVLKGIFKAFQVVCGLEESNNNTVYNTGWKNSQKNDQLNTRMQEMEPDKEDTSRKSRNNHYQIFPSGYKIPIQ